MFGNASAKGLEFVPIMPFVTLFPRSPALVYVTGTALLAAASMLMAARQRRRLVAICTGLLFLGCALLFEAPRVIAAPLDIVARNNFFQVLVFAAAGFMLAGTLLENGNPVVTRLIELGPLLFGLSSIVFGVDHFLIPGFIARLVPVWIPKPLFWAWFTGVAFVAAGLAIVVRFLDRIAAFCLGVMFLLFATLIHGPAVTRSPGAHDPDEWSNILIVVGMAGASWLCALTAQRPARERALS